MWQRSQFGRSLAALLALCLLVGSTLTGGVRAQQQQQSAQQPPAPVQPTPQRPATDVDDDDVVRVETNLTNILLTATDRDRRFITTLKQSDIQIYEDGKPQQIFTFATQVDLPLSLAIVVDTSISQEQTLPAEKAAARAFIDAVLRPQKDEAAIVSFTGDSTLEQGLTSSVARLRRAIDRVEFVPPSGYVSGVGTVGTPPISGTNQSLAGSTALWDAIWVTCDEVLSEASDRTRKAVIVITDGVNTSGQKKLQDSVERAIRGEVLVFAIGIGDTYSFGGVDEGSLRKLTERTGGRAYFPRNEDDLRAAFAQIQEELRQQYLIAYAPTNKLRDGSYRQVRIEVVNPELKRQNLKLSYRQGYFAKGEPGANSNTPRPNRRP